MSSPTHPLEIHSGVITSWLPVTTPGSANPECMSAFYSQGNNTQGPFEATAFDPWYQRYIRRDLVCLPDLVTSWIACHEPALQAPNALTVSSLGPFVCPQQYTTATTITLDATSTLVACCPSDYTFNPAFLASMDTRQCVLQLVLGQAFPYEGQNFKETAPQTSTITIFRDGARIVAAPVNGYVFNSVETSTAPAATSAPATGASSDLSTSARVGISLGVTLGVLAIAGLVVFIFHHRRAKGQQAQGAYSEATKAIDLNKDVMNTGQESVVVGKDIRFALGSPTGIAMPTRPEFRYELGPGDTTEMPKVTGLGISST